MNYTPLVLIAFTTALGAVLGGWLIGLTIGLGILLIANLAIA